MSHKTMIPASVLAVLAMGAPSFGAIFNQIDPIIEQHRTRQQELLAASQTILAQADAEKRDLTSEENTSVDNNTAEFEKLDGEIARREKINAQAALLERPNGRQTEPEPVNNADPAIAAVAPIQAAATQRPAVPAQARPAGAERTFGWRSSGDFFAGVRAACLDGGQMDRRLQNALSTYGNEGLGPDGGFLVPPEFRTTILQKVFAEDNLFGRTNQIPVTGNNLTVPMDMTTPWDSSSGIQAYWTAEAGAITQSKPVFEEVNLKLHKLACLVPVTEELLEDSAALGSYVSSKAAAKMEFALAYSIVWGDGAGKPLGFMNAPCLSTQAIESGPQTTDTINAQNCVKMYSRMPVNSRNSAVWLIHPDAESQLPLMVLGQMPVYLPPGGLSGNQYGMLLGRPVIPHQVCETLGDLGDFMFVDFQQYLAAVKSGGVKSDVSMHLWFDQDVTAFKFTIRVAGQPWWSVATSSRDGAFTQSPFVVLASR